MKLCFPVEVFSGLNSRISGHFGTAPIFITFDTDSEEAGLIYASDITSDGSCSPADGLVSHGVEIVITAGIGPGALKKLMDGGLHVMKAESGIVSEDIQNYHNNRLTLYGYESGKCDCGF